MKKLNKLQKILITIGASLVVLFGATAAHANALIFPKTVQTATATSTTSFLTPGAGTTTLTYDSYQNGPNRKADSATLLVQLQASSTSSVLGIKIQYSQDGIDWYGDNLQVATSSTNIATDNSYSWTAASTASLNKAIVFPVPTRFSRAVFTDTGANASIWAQVVPAVQVSQ